jgi:transcriptional regulator with XRE-family HTH domain
MAKHNSPSDQACLRRLLREIRREAGVRQADLAKALKQPQSFVSKYESGERRLDVLELRGVCHVLGIPLQDFIDRLEKTLS